MTLATKNNALIVKDGKIAENCGCCGGWYCYKQCDSCKTGAIPSAIRTSITYTMGDGSTTFAMRLVRMQTNSQVQQGYCPDFLGRSSAWPVNQGGDPALSPQITFTLNSGFRQTVSIFISLALSFTDYCAAGNAVIIQTGDNLNFGFKWQLVAGGRVANGASLVNGNTFTGPPFVSSAASGMCYGDYPGSGPIPIKTNTGTATDYYGTLTLTVTGVE
jgi:hypothetical protein